MSKRMDNIHIIHGKRTAAALILFTVIISISAGVYFFKEARQSMAQTADKTGASASVPAIDRHMPDHIETATFALG